MRKQIVFFCAMCLLLVSLVGCAPSMEEETSAFSSDVSETTTTKFRTTTTQKPEKQVETPGLCYAADDTLSAYGAKTRVNRQLAGLLYEGLTSVEADWSTSLALAGDIKKNSKTQWTVTIRKDAKFSNGTIVTASDVVNSFTQAKKSSVYSSLVKDIQSVKASGSNAVTVTFSAAVPWAERALSFPVVNGNVGTGPYYYNSKKKTLEASKYAAEKAAIPSFRLEDVSRRSNQQYALESGRVQYYFTDLEEEIPRAITDITVTPVTMPYLVYLGVNSSRTSWSSASMRKAISSAISRKAVAAAGYAGYASIAQSAFPPTIAKALKLSGFSEDAQVAVAMDTWEKQGFGSEKTLSAELIVPKGNRDLVEAAKEIATELKSAGCELKVTSLDASSYISRLNSRNYDFYLGEIRLPNTLSLDALLTSSGAGSYGIPAASMNTYAKYRKGDWDEKQYHDSFMKEMPYIPLVWKQGLSLSSARLGDANGSGANPYENVTKWSWK